jgi:tetratricopeptide (TPR) repeat protein
MEAMPQRRFACVLLLITRTVSAQQSEVPPKSFALNTAAGMALDVQGRYDEARTYLDRAIKLAPTDLDRAKATRTMAISYAFSADCRSAERFSRKAFDYYLGVQDYFNAGETANEIARICLESGDLVRAADWYDRGHETAIQEPDLKSSRADLWNYRWFHAKARIASRLGKSDEARKFVARAKAVLDRGRIPEQDLYHPYLLGYVAFHSGDYAGALRQLQYAQQDDPFILSLTAQCHEKLNDPANAVLYYRKAVALQQHSVPAAFARTTALARLRALE